MWLLLGIQFYWEAEGQHLQELVSLSEQNLIDCSNEWDNHVQFIQWIKQFKV